MGHDDDQPASALLARTRFTPAALACVLVLMAGATAAHAQPASPLPSVAAQPEDARVAQARSIVARGEELFARGNYDAALSEFARAYRLLEGHPHQYRVLHNQAVCHERMFRYDLALPLYEQYLARAPLDESDRAVVEAVVRTLRGLLVPVEITSNVEAELWIDDRHMGRAPGKVLVPAGRHVVELRSSLYEPARAELNFAAGERPRLRLELQRLSNYSGLQPAYFWTGLGLSAAALFTGSVFGARALTASDHGKYRAEQQHVEASAQADQAGDLAGAADVFFITAAVLAATTTVLFFVTDWQETPPEPAPAGRALRTPRARPLGLGARF